jgi:antitoxin MazE
MLVARWGNSLALRLPVSVVKALDLKEGDDVTIDVAGMNHLSVARKPAPVELIDRLKKFRGRLPSDFRFDRIEANSR